MSATHVDLLAPARACTQRVVARGLKESITHESSHTLCDWNPAPLR